MKIIPFDELYHTEFFITEVFSKDQNWYSRNNVYTAIGRPKPSHTFLWTKNCRGRITDSNGNIINVDNNQIVYTAMGIEYMIEFFDTAPDQADTLVIHFQLYDSNGENIAPSLTPVVCIDQVDVSTALKLERLKDEFKKNVVCVPEAISTIYRLFASISKSIRRDNANDRFSCIKEGIELLENDSDMSIKDIAKLCGVSECYFRRLFKEYSGEAPIDFRQRHRIEKAKQLLLSDMFTISEISCELHFSDIYHFSKTFKSIVGVSPSQFIKNRS
jgi:AraC-like DNA-binding protein